VNFAHPISITVLRGGRDPRTGDPLPTTEHTVLECAFDPGSTEEVVGLGVVVRTSPRVFGPYDADVLSNDQILVPGEVDANDDLLVWEVDGDVKRYRNPFTDDHEGCEIPLTRQRG